MHRRNIPLLQRATLISKSYWTNCISGSVNIISWRFNRYRSPFLRQRQMCFFSVLNPLLHKQLLCKNTQTNLLPESQGGTVRIFVINLVKNPITEYEWWLQMNSEGHKKWECCLLLWKWGSWLRFCDLKTSAGSENWKPVWLACGLFDLWTQFSVPAGENIFNWHRKKVGKPRTVSKCTLISVALESVHSHFD